MAKRESPFFAGLDVGDPQVVVVDEGYEVGISGTDLWVHACPRALGLDLHWLYRSGLLNITETETQIRVRQIQPTSSKYL